MSAVAESKGPVFPGTFVFAIYDVDGKCWLGDDKGVKIYTDWDIARAAATLVGEQLGRYMRAQPYHGGATKYKDEITVQKSIEEALNDLESCHCTRFRYRRV